MTVERNKHEPGDYETAKGRLGQYEFMFRQQNYVFTDPMFSVSAIEGVLDVINLTTDKRSILVFPTAGIPNSNQPNYLFGNSVKYPDQEDDVIGDVHVIKYVVPNTARPYLKVVKSTAIVGQSERVRARMNEYARDTDTELAELLEAHTLVVSENNEMITIPLSSAEIGA